MKPDLPLEIRAKIDFAEYWRATHSYMLGIFKFKWFMIIAGLFLALFIYRSIAAPYAAPAYPLLIPPVGLVFLYGMLYLNTLYLFNSKTFLQHEVRYVFSSDGINAIGESTPGETRWSHVPKAIELSQDFLIFYTTERMYTLPKRCFASAEEVARFRRILERELGDRAKLLT